MSEWISVKDKLPQEGENLLVYDEINGIEKTWFTWNPYLCEVGGFTDMGFAIYDVDLLNITHWMPLPEPPKEQS